MKFNPFNWLEFAPNETQKAPKGWLRVRLSQEAALYVSQGKREALAGVASSFDLDLSAASSYRLEPRAKCRAFVYVPEPTSVVFEGEVYTNIDRMPQESGMLAEVTRGLRQLELARRETMREIRGERSSLEKARRDASPALIEPVAAVEPVEPAGDPA